MTTAFLLIAPSAVGDGVSWCPPETLRGPLGVPEEGQARGLRDLAGEIRALPGVLGLFDRGTPAATGILTVDDLPTGTLGTLVDLAVDHRYCLVGYDTVTGSVGEILVNATGIPTDCLMWDSCDQLVLHVDAVSVRDLLVGDAARDLLTGGEPYVIVEPVDETLSPVPGVRFVQAFREFDGTWTVEHRTGDLILGLPVPLADVDEVVQVVEAFLEGDAEVFLGADWVDAGIVRTVDDLSHAGPDGAPADPGSPDGVPGRGPDGAFDGSVDGDVRGSLSDLPGPSRLVFFRARDFDDAPDEFRTTRDFNLATESFLDLARDAAQDGAAATGRTAPVEDVSAESPEVLTDLAAWMNRRALHAAEDPANPPSELYLDFGPYPVRPHGAVLTVTVPSADRVHDDVCADLMLRAASVGLCMLEESGRVWVNASGPATDCRISVRGGGVVTSVTAESLQSTLESAVFAGTEGFVLAVEPVGGTAPPVAGTGEVQVGIGNRRWIVHRITGAGRFELVDPGDTVAEIVGVLTEYTTGDAGALDAREWEDISDAADGGRERWLLSDSAGGLLSVAEEEVHVAVPVNYAADLDWFQVADQVVRGDYITADRHLGTQWSVMWGHGFGEVQYYRRIVDTREAAEALIHAWIDEPEETFLARGWDLVDND